jgi:hypothetical protein
MTYSQPARTAARRGLGAADGLVPAGVTVFDDELPGVVNLDTDLLAALRRAATDAAADGVELVVNSGWRSPEYQERLRDEAVVKYGSEQEAARWVATPTTSAHVLGYAVDIGPPAARAWLSEHGARYGLCQIYRNEPWHYELRPEAVEHGCPPMYADPTRDPRTHRFTPRGYPETMTTHDDESTGDRRLDGGWRESLDETTVEAVGAMTEALETVEIARGHLYAFHQLTGSADYKLERAIELLEKAGHPELAERLTGELLGRNVLPGRWTFQVVEDYEDTYYLPFREHEREVRTLTDGLAHVHEAGLKRRRRSPGTPGHEATPREPAAD